MRTTLNRAKNQLCYVDWIIFSAKNGPTSFAGPEKTANLNKILDAKKDGRGKRGDVVKVTYKILLYPMNNRSINSLKKCSHYIKITQIHFDKNNNYYNTITNTFKVSLNALLYTFHGRF